MTSSGSPPVEDIAEELANLAEACVEATLRDLAPSVPFAVIGVGRLGGRELSYASDIDVLFVYDGSGPADFDVAEKTATRIISGIGATTAEGQTFRIDANLRPEGKKGPLARSLDGYRQYYDKWALTWEFQSLLKARPVAGDLGVAERFCEMVEPYVFRDPFPRGLDPGGPPDEGPDGAGADPTGGGPAVPPEAGPRAHCRTWSGRCSSSS